MSPNESAYGSWPRSGEIDIVETKGSNLDYAAADAHWGISPGYKKHAQGKKYQLDLRHHSVAHLRSKMD